ncbi:MAG: XRE family transcriptional regulator, partial [Chloroflexi bacterium]|nr:XRE family transcriptional regulator [Chloroflexota bacterium]
MNSTAAKRDGPYSLEGDPKANLPTGLRRARELSGFSQEDVGAVLGVSRAMVSYWESGTRKPNDRQRSALARLYGVRLASLAEGEAISERDGDMASMLLRADDEIAPAAVPGIREFGQFLDRFAELARILEEPVRSMTRSPFTHRAQYAQKDDIRRKAEEVRKLLGLGTGPIVDLDPVCELLGITVYRAHLGSDLTRVPSGAFFNHPEVGFSILVNLGMTPGRRRFTVAHEMAHALFHSHETNRVVSRERNPLEAFADNFAGEFLMPREGVRRFMEEVGIDPRISEPADAIRIQRYFRVSWPTTLVRLKQMNAVTQATADRFEDSVRPLHLAQSLGYRVDEEELRQDPRRWRIRRFPRQFLRMLRTAVFNDLLSPMTAASFSGLSLPEIAGLMGGMPRDDDAAWQLTADGSPESRAAG